MSETVKLIIEISKDYYEILKCEVEQNLTDYYPFIVIGNGILLDDVKAELEQFRESLAEKAPSLQDLINAQRTVDICLGIIDNVGKENKE